MKRRVHKKLPVRVVDSDESSLVDVPVTNM